MFHHGPTEYESNWAFSRVILAGMVDSKIFKSAHHYRIGMASSNFN